MRLPVERGFSFSEREKGEVIKIVFVLVKIGPEVQGEVQSKSVRERYWFFLAVQKVGCHEQFESYGRGNGEFRNLGRTVRVADFVREIHAHLLQHVRSDGRERDINK